MKSVSAFVTLLFMAVFFTGFTNNVNAASADGAKYVGAKKCGMCHKSKTGNQYGIWKKSKHAKAFEVLLTKEADDVAKKQGLGKASEAKECLSCHVTGHNDETAVFSKKFKVESGIQCETCHGPGSKYKSKKVMKDRDKAISKGLILYADEAAIEKKCRTCHNEKSPFYKKFEFNKRWAQIAHPLPKK